MSNKLSYTEIDGIRCFSPEVAESYADYPDEGFDVTDEEQARSFWVRSRNRLFKKMVEGQQLPNTKTRLLEIGCGTGNFLEQIADNRSLVITGSEIYLKGLLYAKKKLPDVNFIQFDVAQGEIGETFDVIVAFDVIEHIDNDIAALANINKMLSPGGRLIMTVPQHMFLWSSLDELVKHKRRYSRTELLSKLGENGFKVSYATSFVFVLFPLMVLSRIFEKKSDKTQSETKTLAKKVSFSSSLNFVFDRIMRIDELLIRFGVSLPFGGTLVVVANKR